MSQAIHIDGSQGEGGGQVLRTSLSLALASGRGLRVTNVRAGRSKPGLLRQHLTALRALGTISDARIVGDELGSTAIELGPGAARPGEYSFAVGTAGSATLVLQTVLLPLALAGGPSTVRVEGGTHNPMAPPFEFLARSYLPLLARMGVHCEASLERHGFHPAGGGALEVKIEAARDPLPLDLCERGELRSRRARILLAHLPASIAEEESAALVRALGWGASEIEIVSASDSAGPGNSIDVIYEHEQVTNVFTSFGRKGLSGRRVAKKVAKQANTFAGGAVPVDEHLADQLLLPMALLAGGRFRCWAPSSHTATNLDVMDAFGLAFQTHDLGGGRFEIRRSH